MIFWLILLAAVLVVLYYAFRSVPMGMGRRRDAGPVPAGRDTEFADMGEFPPPVHAADGRDADRRPLAEGRQEGFLANAAAAPEERVAGDPAEVDKPAFGGAVAGRTPRAPGAAPGQFAAAPTGDTGPIRNGHEAEQDSSPRPPNT